MVTEMKKTLESHQLVRHTVALVLAGGRGSRLKQLTDSRAKPAVYFGGKFRIIDFALSNCLNSGIRRMAVVTQYKSHSLMRHMVLDHDRIIHFVHMVTRQNDDVFRIAGTDDVQILKNRIRRAPVPMLFSGTLLRGQHVHHLIEFST